MPLRPMLPTLALLLLALTLPSPAQTKSAIPPPATDFTELADFGNGHGEDPNAPLAQGLDGNFYGTTYLGPYPTNGFAFKMTPTGIFSTFDYSCTQNECTGREPNAGLVLASDGNFYGTTYEGGDGAYQYKHGGTSYGGTVVQLNPQSGLSTFYSFCSEVNCDDGANPFTPLIQGSDGNLYGVTSYGGANGVGTVFSLTAGGTLTTLYTFASTGGNFPEGGLIQATDGNFYGTTQYGGTGASCGYEGGCGTIFKITSQGTLTTLYNFCEQSNCADGFYPRGSLIQAADGSLYGVTGYGGTNTKSGYYDYGTVFKITTSGEFTTLYSFCALTDCADGNSPAGIIQATDGNFYGATYNGGAYPYSNGTLFKLTSAGALTTLHTFCPKGGDHCADGQYPEALMQATDGNFYGVTDEGGNHGTAFRLSMGLAAFVETVTASGAPGSSVIILGSNLTGSSKVTFNGTAATFTLVSSTEITATIPTAATTGPIVVTTPKGTLTSNKNFQITE